MKNITNITHSDVEAVYMIDYVPFSTRNHPEMKEIEIRKHRVKKPKLKKSELGKTRVTPLYDVSNMIFLGFLLGLFMIYF